MSVLKKSSVTDWVGLETTMRRVLTVVGAIPFVLVTCASAMAQGGGYTIQTPGQPRTFVSPLPNGGYTAQTPGQPTTFYNPSGHGGGTIFTPGQPRTFVSPSGNGGYIVQTPGQPTTFVSPR
jgi:hypothetical protein